MTRLSGRRFPHEITRVREAPGDYNQYGEFVPGIITRQIVKSNVQPLSLSDDIVSEGARIMNRIKVYVPVAPLTTTSPLLAASTDHNPDKVQYRGDTYVVEESWFWGDHVRATCLFQPVTP